MSNAIDRNLKWLKLKKFKNTLTLYTPNQNNNKLNQIFLGISSSGNKDNKKWPINFFCLLIENLKYLNFDFIIAGAKKDIFNINKIKSQFKNLKITSLENLNLHDAMVAIKDAKFYIGNDTGFMHVYSGLGMKSYCLYGDTPSHNSIYNKNIIPIIPDGYTETLDNSLAMNKITVSKVLRVFKKNL